MKVRKPKLRAQKHESRRPLLKMFPNPNFATIFPMRGDVRKMARCIIPNTPPN